MESAEIPMNLKLKMRMKIVKGETSLNSKRCLKEILIKMV